MNAKTIPIPPDFVPTPEQEELIRVLQAALDGAGVEDGWVARELRAAGYRDAVIWDARDLTWGKAVAGIRGGESWAVSPDALRGWLRTTARRDAATVARLPHHRLHEPLPDDHPSQVEDDGPCPVLLARVRDAARHLTRDEQRAVVAVHIRGFSGRGAARRLGWSPTTVRHRLARGERRLLERLMPA